MTDEQNPIDELARLERHVDQLDADIRSYRRRIDLETAEQIWKASQ